MKKGFSINIFMVSGCSCGMMTMIKKINLGVLISGGGNTLQNFIDQIEQGKLNA
ncbi:MAG: Phosphoribosylglycinamide formyltransferase, partial [Candidatus Brocadiaceae bacterium]|nr:Phosphoribosylglycinamide formyltransferase [Candidatus Brocadiaceae bacterium]